ncbi:Gfo/Idh/MocA family protein [Spongiivirga citrea]|uniref:Gfo/Idh/MocA family oxidoreductase n=1 Tax=Spongiivirga citrea TaxID=1481457 RepID=A0A6M0CVJ2_9FLAO|nr:Gfo/Idh/MocA family oxidoreductase [Spongiivirga citrea]NER17800.1 Gfo/Idh/MocA family oxidoreductase [Spongiivirga citrea]
MLKGVCIGLGYFSKFHLEAWNRISGVEITAVCDVDELKVKNAVLQYKIPHKYISVEQMLIQEQPDFIDIITPPETHLDLVLLAIKYNVHIICQKPLAPSLKEANKMLKVLKKSSVRMMVHENFRFQPWHREIKELLRKDTIGELYAINSRMRMGDGWQPNAYMDRQPYFREMKKLLMYETGIHFIDLFSYYAGKITKVYARLKRLNTAIKGEDFSWVQFDFENGAVGFLDANRYNESTNKNPRLTFGTILFEGSKGSIRLYEDGIICTQLLGEKEQQHDYEFKDQNFAGDCVYFTQKHFIDCLINKVPFETEVSTYLSNLIVLDRIYESHQKKIPIQIS